MRDWIVGLAKAATEREPGLAAPQWPEVENRAGQPMPDELRDLYSEMNGAAFVSGVRLFSLGGNGAPGVLDRSAPDRWTFGEREGQELFSARKRAVAEEAQSAPLPDWFQTLPGDDWVYGLRRRETGETKLYRTLEHLLAVLVPPVETEEFGENTFARALTAVQGAIGSMTPAKAAPLEPAAKKAAPKAKKKAAPRKATAKKKPAKKVAKKAAKKPARKPAKKKPVRKAAKKKPSRKKR
jgi:hypothetical protein